MKKGLLSKILVCGLAGILTLGLVGCGAKEEDKKDTNKLVIGTSADYPPYEFLDSKNNIVGFDIMIAEEIAKDMGYELEVKNMEFDSLVAGVQSGKIDFAISGMTPTEERKESVDFSDIYYVAEHGIIVRNEDKDTYKTLDDLAGKKVGVQKGSIQVDLAKDNIKDVELKELGKVTDLMLELQNKKVDAIVVELPVAKLNVEKNKDLSLMDLSLKDENGGSAVAVKKGNTELVEKINKTLNKLMEEKKVDEFIVKATELYNEQ